MTCHEYLFGVSPRRVPCYSFYSLVHMLSGHFLISLSYHVLQKNAYLPEPHTDFIFAIILEETGILGGLALIFLFIFLKFIDFLF